MASRRNARPNRSARPVAGRAAVSELAATAAPGHAGFGAGEVLPLPSGLAAGTGAMAGSPPSGRCFRGGRPWRSSFGGRSLKSVSKASGVDGLLGDQLLRERVEPVAVDLEDLGGPLVGPVDDRADLLVDRLGDLVGVVALLTDLAAEEDQLVALPEGQRAEPVAHAELGDHPASQVGRLLDVVRGARRRVAEDHPLGDVAAEQAGDLVLELGLRLEVAVLGREGHRVAEGHATADDRDLLDRVALRKDPLDDGVAALVVGDDQLLGVRDDAALALGTGDDPLERLLEVGHDDGLAVPARSEDRALVDEVREVRAGEARRLAGEVLDRRPACRAACPSSGP